MYSFLSLNREEHKLKMKPLSFPQRYHEKFLAENFCPFEHVHTHLKKKGHAIHILCIFAPS